MANDTFGQIWNRVLLYAPDCPPALAREFVRNTYSDIARAHYWSDLYRDGEFTIPSIVTSGTVAAVNGANTMVGTATGWTADILYRQISIDNIAPWYTITAVDTGTQTITLDRVYGGVDDATASYMIGQFYVDFPTDLNVLERLRDQLNGWYLNSNWYTEEYLDRVDAKRQSSGTPTIAVACPPRIASDGTTIPRYELWPKMLAEKSYIYRYRKLHELEANSDRIIEVLHPETVVFGALAQLALWPGTPTKPNPYFSQETHGAYVKQYDEMLQQSILVDENRMPQMVQIGDDQMRRFPFDARYIQNHIW